VGWCLSRSQQRLIANHFFFVSDDLTIGEGHSNALTEAMDAGLVPICSDHGFNRDVIGNCGFLLPATGRSGGLRESPQGRRPRPRIDEGPISARPWTAYSDYSPIRVSFIHGILQQTRMIEGRMDDARVEPWGDEDRGHAHAKLSKLKSSVQSSGATVAGGMTWS